MKTFPWTLGLTFILCLLTANVASAQFKFSNPFKKKTDEAPIVADTVDPQPEKKFSLPKFPKFGGPKKAPAAPKATSPVVKANQGTKNFFGGMKNWFNWNKSAQPTRNTRSGRVTGGRAEYDGSPTARSASRESKERGGFKFPWFGKKEEPEQPPASVADFLKQPRPDTY